MRWLFNHFNRRARASDSTSSGSAAVDTAAAGAAVRALDGVVVSGGRIEVVRFHGEDREFGN